MGSLTEPMLCFGRWRWSRRTPTLGLKTWGEALSDWALWFMFSSRPIYVNPRGLLDTDHSSGMGKNFSATVYSQVGVALDGRFFLLLLFTTYDLIPLLEFKDNFLIDPLSELNHFFVWPDNQTWFFYETEMAFTNVWKWTLFPITCTAVPPSWHQLL